MRQLPFQAASDYIARHFGSTRHDVAIVLGSGLGGFTKHLPDNIALKTSDIPDYPRSTVVGHRGEIASVKVGKKRVLVFSGRVHYYESASTIDAAVTAIVSHQLGIRRIVLTNAAGILNMRFTPGDLMLLKDQINLTFRNVLAEMNYSEAKLRGMHASHPLIGEDKGEGEFQREQSPSPRNKHSAGSNLPHRGEGNSNDPDASLKQPFRSEAPIVSLEPIYDGDLAKTAFAAAGEAKINLKSGVYVGLTGPSYETPAEVNFIRKVGGDAVGMSTIQEAIFARSVGMKVLGISCLANYTTGMTSKKLSHEEVTEIAAKVDEKFSRLLTTFVELI